MTLTEIRRIVDELRAYVNSPDHTADPRLADVAQQYAAAARECNERLQRCSDLLARGHRPDAIALAEAEPDLLALVSLLSFVEFPEWQELAATYGWERPPTLKRDVAEGLSAAYTTEAKLQDLLRNHRRLAISQSPLKDRLAAMRQIAGIDAETAFWREDVRVFEERRAAELASLFDEAAQSRQADRFAHFLTQFEQEDWHNDPPRALSQQYCRAAEAVALPSLVGRMESACVSKSLEGLLDSEREWNSLLERLRRWRPEWTPDEAVMARVAPAIQMLERHRETERINEFHRDVNLLMEALQKDAPREQVDYYLERARSHGYQLPPDAEAQLRDYHGAATTNKILSTTLIVVLILALLVGLVIAFLSTR